MDDILIFSTRQQHWEDLENLFHVLIKFGLKISPHKCQLFRDKLVYMGLEFLIKDGTAHYTAMRDKCDAIRNMKAPKSVKECRTFCGMVNFLSTFCKNLRQLLIPIYELTKKHARFNWTDKHQKAFDEIKQLLVKPPVLRMVSGNGFFRLESDTSRTAAGATLYQWQNNEWVLVGYHSKRLPDAVQNYGVTELELTGLLANIHGFEQKLNNNYFEAIVDHKAIDYLIKSKHEPTSTRLVTLLDRLNRYTFDLKYLEGSKLKVSDALSRLYSEEKHKISDVIPLNFLLHFTDYQLHKESDHLANKLYAHKRTKLIAKTRRNYDRQGPYRTFLTMRKQFYFPNMLPKIQKYIEACTLCQRTKPKNTKQRPYYGRIPTEYVPCENLAVDLKKMPMGIIYHEFLLIATCEKTNFVHAIPMQNRQTETIANALLHRVCCLTGPPTKLSIDQDAALTSVVIKEMLTSLECTMQIISPWNHGSSKAERQIQTIGNMINKHLTQKGASWPLYAAVSAYAMNTFASTALQGLSPFELVFARKPRQLTSFELPKITSFPVEYREFFRLLLDRAKMYRDMDLEWRTLQALELRDRNKTLTNIETFHLMIWFICSLLIHPPYSLKHKSLGKIILVHWPLIQNWTIRIIY